MKKYAVIFYLNRQFCKPIPATLPALFESLSPVSVCKLAVGSGLNVVISPPAPTCQGCCAVRDGVGRLYMFGFSRLVTPRSVAPWLFSVSPGRIIFGPMSGLGTRPASLKVLFVLISLFSFTVQEKMCGSTAVLEVSAAMSRRPTQACGGERGGAGSQGLSFWPSFSYILSQNFILLLLCVISSQNQKLLAVDDDS